YSPQNWQAVAQVARELGQESGTQVVDARDWIPQEEAFADGHHLLPATAREFTFRLAKWLPPSAEQPHPDVTATNPSKTPSATRAN
ncbi:MAG: hypothetical protein ACKOGA_03070, partial [Planctomycetaceae bacterium]